MGDEYTQEQLQSELAEARCRADAQFNVLVECKERVHELDKTNAELLDKVAQWRSYYYDAVASHGGVAAKYDALEDEMGEMRLKFAELRALAQARFDALATCAEEKTKQEKENTYLRQMYDRRGRNQVIYKAFYGEIWRMIDGDVTHDSVLFALNRCTEALNRHENRDVDEIDQEVQDDTV